MEYSKIYEAVSGKGDLQIQGVIVLNLLLLVITALFVEMLFKWIRKCFKKPDILKSRTSKIIGVALIYLVLIVLQILSVF